MRSLREQIWMVETPIRHSNPFEWTMASGRAPGLIGSTQKKYEEAKEISFGEN